mmetsp:Transcript_12470/g.9068  ORF Transcript_12470/g.9068 Transcript_12470/m.9068 type:complete len:87 (+) Transcript_12470:158-418(+)
MSYRVANMTSTRSLKKSGSGRNLLEGVDNRDIVRRQLVTINKKLDKIVAKEGFRKSSVHPADISGSFKGFLEKKQKEIEKVKADFA